jgi:hypothetical protein
VESANQMPKHSTYSVKEEVEKVEEVTVRPRERAETVKIALRIDAKVQVQGSVSGKTYLFSGAGSVVDVDKLDVDALLQKRQGGRQCCGGTDNGNQVFETVTEK